MKKNEIILFIDTSNNKEVSVTLTKDGKDFQKKETAASWTSQLLLPLIDKLLAENGVSAGSLTEIRVNTGPGSYTGLRVGCAVANTLGYLFSIPVNGQDNGIAVPVYDPPSSD